MIFISGTLRERTNIYYVAYLVELFFKILRLNKMGLLRMVTWVENYKKISCVAWIRFLTRDVLRICCNCLYKAIAIYILINYQLLFHVIVCTEAILPIHLTQLIQLSLSKTFFFVHSEKEKLYLSLNFKLTKKIISG